jgi:hypothetical protein
MWRRKVIFSDITSLQNFTKIDRSVQKLLLGGGGTDTHTHTHTQAGDLISLLLFF